MRIFISAGEPSGDLHAANLIRALRKRAARRRVRRLRRPADGGGRGASCSIPLVDLAVMWFLPRAAQPPQVPRLARPGRPLLPRPAARRRRADRLPRLPLVDRPPGQGAGHPGLLLRAAADLGLGRLAGQEGPQVRRSRPVQPAVRAGLVSRPGRARARSTSAIRTSTSSPSGRSTTRSSPSSERRGGPSWRSCPARGPRRSPVTCPIMLRAARELARERPDVRFVVACLHERHRALAERSIAERDGVRPADSRSTPARRPS